MTTPACTPNGTPPSLNRLVGKMVLRGIFEPTALTNLDGWRAFREGIDILPLYGHPEVAGPSAALLRYSPGARVPLHSHAGHEHIVVLQGSQQDAQGCYGRGTCIISTPGSRHAVVSEEGCVVLAIWHESISVEASQAER